MLEMSLYCWHHLPSDQIFFLWCLSKGMEAVIRTIFRNIVLVLAFGLAIPVGIGLLLLFNRLNTSPPAAWATVVEYAQQAAEEIDPEAVPFLVTVMVNDNNTANPFRGDSYRCVWEFMRPSNGQVIQVDIDNTDMENIETIIVAFDPPLDMPYNLHPYPISADEQHERRAALASVRVSPDEAAHLTEENGTPFGDQARLSGMTLRIGPSVEERIGTSVVWSTLTRGRIGEGKVYITWIDARNGTILGHTNEKSYYIPTAEPPSTTAPTASDP